MFDNYSAFCEVLGAQLKQIQEVRKYGQVIGSAMLFDSRLGEITITVHNDMMWYNDDDRQEVHLKVFDQTFKGNSFSDVFYKFQSVYPM